MGHSMGLSHNLKTTSSVKLNLFNRSIPFLMIQRESKRFLAVKMSLSAINVQMRYTKIRRVYIYILYILYII
jgi:hypothetical protein